MTDTLTIASTNNDRFIEQEIDAIVMDIGRTERDFLISADSPDSTAFFWNCTTTSTSSPASRSSPKRSPLRVRFLAAMRLASICQRTRMLRGARGVTVAFVAVLAAFCTGFGAYDDPKKLTVEGAPGVTLATYTVDQLKTEFPLQSLETRTPWTKNGEKIGFRGPFVKDVLARHGLASHAAVEFIAYDNFFSEIPLAEINDYAPILAVERLCTDHDRQQGICAPDQEYRRLSFKELGPIFVVWPFEQLPDSYVPARNSIWVWFVVAVRPVP
ncbi:hypothetical protein ACWTU6_27995 [Mesorhizobium sp. BHbsci]